MNADRVFIDTNVLIYLYSKNNEVKQQKAMQAINNYDCIVSTQVLNEFCNVCINKLKISYREIKDSIDEILAVCDLAVVTEKTIHQALILRERYGFSYYDSLIISSAIECNCKYLFTEDLSNGQVIDCLKIIDIFIGEINGSLS